MVGYTFRSGAWIACGRGSKYDSIIPRVEWPARAPWGWGGYAYSMLFWFGFQTRTGQHSIPTGPLGWQRA